MEISRQLLSREEAGGMTIHIVPGQISAVFAGKRQSVQYFDAPAVVFLCGTHAGALLGGKEVNMTKSILITIAALGILATPGLAQKSKGNMPKNKPPIITKFDTMSKSQLQTELKRLQAACPLVRISMQEAKNQAATAVRKYKHTPDSEKYDALIKTLEIEADLGVKTHRFKEIQREFRAARRAYKQHLIFEKTGKETDSSRRYTLQLKGASLNILVSQLQDLTGKTVIVDPDLQGDFTVKTEKKLSEAEWIKLITHTLATQGLSLEEINEETLRVRTAS